MATEISRLIIGAADRKNDALRVELWRTVSAVGNWVAYLRNTDGQFNGVFDVQDALLIDVNGTTLMQGRVDGPAVALRGRDLESDWDEYAIIKGVDEAQDLLFHNDFDYDYPDVETAAQTLHSVWNGVINIQLGGNTNITYIPPGASPVVGSVEFREGTNFLATTQDLFRRARYIFYVDDVLAFQSGAPALAFSPTGITLNSVAGDANNNILDIVDLQERDGDKHYNYIRFYGKNPMFDGYTEGNVPAPGGAWLVGWHPWQAVLAGLMANDQTTTRVGGYSIVAYNNNPVNQHIRLYYTLPYYNYTSFDFTKGELGVWAYYDDTAGAPGTPGAGSMGAGGPGGVWPWNVPTCLWVRLTDGAARTAEYFGTSTMLYRGVWGWCSFPLGQDGGAVASAQNQWFFSNPAFDWGDIQDMYFSVRPGGGFAAANYPSHVYLDGMTIPEPCIAVADGVTGTATDGTGTMTGSPVTLVRGLNTPTVTVAGTFTIDLPDGVVGIAATGGWIVTGSPVTLTEGANVITVQPAGAGVINITLASKYRRRPYVDYRQHINTQNSLYQSADQFLAQVEKTTINKIRVVTEGNLALRYAGQSVIVNIPSIGLTNEEMYITQLHHIIEPYKDVSGGFGFDWVTEVDAVPISGVAYDMGRLRTPAITSSFQSAASIGTGARVK